MCFLLQTLTSVPVNSMIVTLLKERSATTHTGHTCVIVVMVTAERAESIVKVTRINVNLRSPLLYNRESALA